MGGNGVFVAAGGRRIFYSTDGITWGTARELHPDTFIHTVKFGGGVFVALGVFFRSSPPFPGGPPPGPTTPEPLTGFSTNGINWEVWTTSGLGVTTFFRITEHARGKFYAVHSGEAFVSSTGTNDWSSFSRAGFVNLQFLNGHYVYLRKDPGTVVNINEVGDWGTDAIGITNTLLRAAYDGSEYYFVGEAGAIVKTVGAQKLSSLTMGRPQNGNVEITVAGRPGAYTLQQSPSPHDAALNLSEIQLHFTLEGASTNLSLPLVQPNSFFRLIERN